MQKGDSSKIGDPDNPSNSLYDVTQVHGGIQKEKIQLISVGAPVLTATH